MPFFTRSDSHLGVALFAEMHIFSSISGEDQIKIYNTIHDFDSEPWFSDGRKRAPKQIRALKVRNNNGRVTNLFDTPLSTLRDFVNFGAARAKEKWRPVFDPSNGESRANLGANASAELLVSLC